MDYNHRIDDPAGHLSKLRLGEFKIIKYSRKILLRSCDSPEHAFDGSPDLALT